MSSQFQGYLPLASALLTALAVFLGSQYVLNNMYDKRLRALRSKMLSAYKISKFGNVSTFKKTLNQTSLFLDSYGSRLVRGNYRERLKRLLVTSGDWENEKYGSLIRQKTSLAIAGATLGFTFLVVRGGSTLLLTVVFTGVGFFLPDILLKNRVLKRKKEMADTLPDAIDMLQMCVSAGLAFPAALSRVADTQKGPVAEEFARVTAEVQLGQSRAQALNAMADRSQEPHMEKFVSAMAQVDQFGIPISNVLVEQSKQMRSIRRERARERGQKVPIKLLGPVILCFLPSVIVIILGPAVLSIIKAFSS
ncbi:unannotated protein [freshwater metagenome]|uniref:Unannotated protein n=1 Tax=freshwater metagenome TaxID=449393 RepID=A0A6J7XWF8_9ZZZZ|nr:hypothetical protein [Actinomycetota bacterium]